MNAIESQSRRETPAPEDRSRLFVAIVTGQAVANLPPLLHLAQPGDEVLWLWTTEQTPASTEMLIPLLQARLGLRSTVYPRPIPSALADLPAWWAAEWPGPVLRQRAVTLVANGGTKPLFLALVQAIGPTALQEVVYAQGQPVDVVRLPQGLATRSWCESFGGIAVTLEQVLACSGYEIFTRDPAKLGVRLWADGAVKRPLPEPLPAFMQPAAFTSAWGDGSAMTPKQRGDAFERAVAHRCLDLIEQRPAWHAIVSELWLGVNVARSHRPELYAADWDVLLVLRNGVLIYMECKTGQAQKPELDASWQKLRDGSSSLATMWVCSPLPSALAWEDGWFKRLHSLRDEAAWLGRPHLAWTLPDQPAEYGFGGRRFRVPSFETQFDELMAPYLP